MPTRSNRTTKPVELERLAVAAQGCRLCFRMEHRTRVLSGANGPLDSKIMFVGEAPGRLGADSTSIPFHGDKTGDNFDALLRQVGLTRYDCFVTNALLCNPRDEEGNNATPTKNEAANCSSFLRRQIELIDPKIVVTLGTLSLSALNLIQPHGLVLAAHVRSAHAWNGRVLIPLYHPGQRAMIHRSFSNQLADYQFVAETFRRGTKGTRPNASGKALDDVVLQVVRGLLARGHEMAYFRLHKLYYLVEYMHYKNMGRRLTRAYIIRQKDGPYITDLHIGSLRRSMRDIQPLTRGDGQLSVRLRKTEGLFCAPDVKLGGDIEKLVDDAWSRYGGLSNEQLKTAVYMTTPMRALLRKERRGIPTFNQPIEFGLS